MWIDTHAHIYSEKYSNIEEVVSQAKKANIEKILMPNIDMDSIEDMHKLSVLYDNYCLPMMGLHPCSVDEGYKNHLSKMYQLLKINKHNYCAVGEIGTDLHWSDTYYEQQKLAFIEQVKWSFAFDLPIVVHCRNSVQETIEILNSLPYKQYKGVFHAFSGNLSQAMQLVEKGFYIGIGGMLTYKKNPIREIIGLLPKDRIVLETDSPYLTPVPYRNKTNKPEYIPIIGSELASFWGISPQEVAELTTHKAKRLFSL